MNIFKQQCACGKEFKQKKNLYAHMRKQHNIEPLQQQNKAENYVCDFCERKFVCQSSIIRHLKRFHSDSNNKLIGVNKKVSLNCPYGNCAQSLRTYEVLREHLAKKHDFQVEFEELTFNSVEDFEQWKDSMQLRTASLYAQSTAGRTLRVELGRRLYFNCHRSNVYKRRGNHVRAIKSLGTNKIGKACPSRLEVTYTAYAGQMIIKVNFWKTHCGHTNQVERLPLNRQMKCAIAEKLENGYSFKEIFQWIHDNRNQDEVSERLQLISHMDLYNIIREFNIKPAKKHTRKRNNVFKVNINNISVTNDGIINIFEVNDGAYNKPSTSVSENEAFSSIDNKNDEIFTKNDNRSTILSKNDSKVNKVKVNDDKYNPPSTSVSENNSLLISKNDEISTVNDDKNNMSITNASKNSLLTTNNSENDNIISINNSEKL